MVNHNPLFVAWDLKRFVATVANDIWPEVVFFSLVAAGECDTLTPPDARFQLTCRLALASLAQWYPWFQK